MVTASRWSGTRHPHDALGKEAIKLNSLMSNGLVSNIRCSCHSGRFKKSLSQGSRKAEHLPSLADMMELSPLWCHNVHWYLTIVSSTSVTMMLVKTWHHYALIRRISPPFMLLIYIIVDYCCFVFYYQHRRFKSPSKWQCLMFFTLSLFLFIQ